MKIVFMGTPEFAVPSLQSLLDEGHEVLAAYTQPDKPKGRGYKLAPPPVKELALLHHIPVYQPLTLKNGEAAEKIKSLAPDCIVVVAYGKILPKAVLDIPKYGCVNVHASLLPKYRGAGPIQWSVINGEKETGVTTMYMAEGIDTGDMILQEKTSISPDETAGELHDRLSVLGGGLIAETLRQIESGKAPRIPQNDGESCYAPMLDKALSGLDFEKAAKEVHCKIMGLSPWPAATAVLDQKLLKIHRSRLHPEVKGECGEIVDENKFIVACRDGGVELLTVQLEGGKKMNSSDFLRGHPIKKGNFLQKA